MNSSVKMPVSQVNKKKRKSHNTSEMFNLEIGEYIITLDKLYGAARAQKIAFLLGQRKICPILSSAAAQIMRNEENKSVLLKALDANNVLWCTTIDNVIYTYQFDNCPIFDTTCYKCSSKIIFVRGKPITSKYGSVECDWRIYANKTIVYQCEVFMLICAKCSAK